MSGNNRENTPWPNGAHTGTTDPSLALADYVVRQHNEAQRSAARGEQSITLVYSRHAPAIPSAAAAVPISATGAAVSTARVVAANTTGTFRRLVCLSVLGVLVIVATVLMTLNGTQPAEATATERPDVSFVPPTVATAANVNAGLTVVPNSLRAPKDDLGQSIYARHLTDAPANERACLAKALYYEARGETYEGQIAVAQVIVNRTRFKGWPDTICGVVHQGADRGEKCQFSFVCRTSLHEPRGEAWDQAQTIAEAVMTGRAWLREAIDATHYHTVNVAPVWRLGLTPIRTIGAHIFYQETNGHTRETKAYGLQTDRPILVSQGNYAPTAAIKTIELQNSTTTSPKLPTPNPRTASPAEANTDWSQLISQR
jgi:hypothetical protein